MKKNRENPYQAVSIPKESLEKIKAHVQQYDYKNIADFIRVAIEDRIEIDVTEGGFLANCNGSHVRKKKPTMASMQEQLDEIQRELLQLKYERKKRLF